MRMVTMATMRAMPTGTTMTLTPPNFPDPLSLHAFKGQLGSALFRRRI
jgi:hypothetical protein